VFDFMSCVCKSMRQCGWHLSVYEYETMWMSSMCMSICDNVDINNV
jgi:hypothetical protein